jgi:hypothetical protein
MASAYETLATALKAIIDAEFVTEGFVAVHDRLHESLGSVRTEVGISPERWVPWTRDRNTKLTYVLVQFYNRYDLEIDPEQRVDPLVIADYAERVERAIQTTQASTPGTGEMWYFDVDSVDFPQDPTGNKSRFHMIVVGRGDNAALIA